MFGKGERFLQVGWDEGFQGRDTARAYQMLPWVGLGCGGVEYATGALWRGVLGTLLVGLGCGGVLSLLSGFVGRYQGSLAEARQPFAMVRSPFGAGGMWSGGLAVYSGSQNSFTFSRLFLDRGSWASTAAG